MTGKDGIKTDANVTFTGPSDSLLISDTNSYMVQPVVKNQIEQYCIYSSILTNNSNEDWLVMPH